MVAPVISANNLYLSLGSGGDKVGILRDVSIELQAGQRTALLGPSGSGKTSLLMLLGGLQAPSAGTIELHGETMTGKSEDALAKMRSEHIGIVFQQFHLIPGMTALQNVMLPLELADISRTNAQSRGEMLLRDVGLGDRFTHLPGQLSGGEQQRVAIARACAAKPKLILADEPTGNLDGETGERVMQLLFEQQAAHDASLLIVTHDTKLAARCDRILRMEAGNISE